ncbi:U3 snoRNP protein [Bachmanniomyces sp. S44760]|nr:U3 snoRNP protein [Bachmanniomyces sp. S44760]
MAAVSSGIKPNSRGFRKGGTVSERKHRFESFNQRISKLKIEPVRRTRRRDVDDDELGQNDSYFKSGLLYWKDINLSENFSAFVLEVEPKCNSLPQIIHHHGMLADTLVRYIEKRDNHSLEPLLGLVSHLAHDMGFKFEVHFRDLVTLVTSLAAKHPDIEVIEWSFSCLAWLFKYLSRLLVPDLRPLFDIMAPLLGKECQKPFVNRFAAEAMSFLVRKAAISYSKDPAPLRDIIRHVFSDLSKGKRGSRESQAYTVGIMTLFTSSMKIIQNDLHSSCTDLYRCLIETLLGQQTPDTACIEVMYGTTINLVHHTVPATFRSVLDIILSNIKLLSEAEHISSAPILANLLLIVGSVRKGSRIEDWQPVVDSLILLLREPASYTADSQTQDFGSVLYACAVIFQYSTLDIVVSRFQLAIELLVKNANGLAFLSFCNYFNCLGSERFETLLAPHVLRYLDSVWSLHEPTVCLLIPRLVQGSRRLSGQSKMPVIPCSIEWQQRIADVFRRAKTDASLLPLCSAYLKCFSHLSLEPSQAGEIWQCLEEMVVEASSSEGMLTDQARFIFCIGLNALLKHASFNDGERRSRLIQLCFVSSQYGSVAAYLESVFDYFSEEETSIPEVSVDQLVLVLIDNLSSPSSPLRKSSLRLLGSLYLKTRKVDSEFVRIALNIEEAVQDLHSGRTVSMHIRNLSGQFQSACEDTWLSKAMPNFCFGMFSIKMAQVWKDAIDLLKVLCYDSVMEANIAELAFQWLEKSHEANASLKCEDATQSPAQHISTFQCSNLRSLEMLACQRSREIKYATNELESQYQSAVRGISRMVPASTHHALQVLKEIPNLAERRSKRLVPTFLAWAKHETEAAGINTLLIDHNDSISSESTILGSQKLVRKEQKSMLDLFGRFNNPRVLYKSSVVFDNLLALLTNADAEIQRLALGSIFKWKIPGVQRYQENLMNLLDDARFREELSLFVHVDDTEGGIEYKHRQELMPVLLRLLYGRMTSRAGNSNNSGQAAKRKAVLGKLSHFSDEELQTFIKIALGPLESQVFDPELHEEYDRSIDMPSRKQVGLLNVLKEMLETLGSRLQFAIPVIIKAIIYCMAVSKLAMANTADIRESEESPKTSLFKSIRQLGIQCLYLLFTIGVRNDFEPYMKSIFEEVINTRLGRLPIETAQSISGMLRLVSTWTTSTPMTLYLTEYNPLLFKTVIDCLGIPSAKDEVKLYVLDQILKPIIRHTEFKDIEDHPIEPNAIHHPVEEQVLRPNLDHLLDVVGRLIQGRPHREVLISAVNLISLVAPKVTGSPQIGNLLVVASFLLSEPSQRIHPRAKGDLLHILKSFIPVYSFEENVKIRQQLFVTTSSLFGFFRDRINRALLSEVFTLLAQGDPELQAISGLCKSLNSFSARTIDEPDFDERLKAFSVITRSKSGDFSARQWRPILYNMLFFIRDNEEIAIRSNASFGLRRFVETQRMDESDSLNSDLLEQLLLPALRSGVNEKSELVRTEFVNVMGLLIRHNPEWKQIKDMCPLLVNDDDEASFFNNILHIQQHRRLRALRRLATEGRAGKLSSANVAQFFLPLIEHFIFDRAEDENSHTLAAESVNSIGDLANCLEWPQYRAIFRRFASYIQTKPEMQKVVVKLLGTFIDALDRETVSKYQMIEESQTSENKKTTAVNTLSTLATTLPRREKFEDDLTRNLLPSLLSYIHDKDESTVSLRVPVAVSVVKLLKTMPSERLAEHLPPILTDICHILRSRSQDSRDLTRKTLADIAVLMGPPSFGFLLRELRGSLLRGYQLHVLSFTVHSLLVATAPLFKPGDLDYCLPQIVAIIMDDIFGAIGQEKDAEEYISKMREVKSSKSYDSMELIAKTTSIDHIAQLINPISTLLDERLDLKMVKKIDELLRRLGSGLLHNDAIESLQTLVFCFEVVQNVYNSVLARQNTVEDPRMKRYLVNLRFNKAGGALGTTATHRYKLAKFSFDLLRSILRKYDTLQTAVNLAGFIPLINESLFDAHEEVQISTLRLLSTIIKAPLKELDENATAYTSEAVKIIRNCISTNTEIAQAALKFVSAALRERRAASWKESDLAYLLQRVKPDLEEPDRQGVIFNFVKALMTRKVVIPEIYEILDTVATMMITNQNKGGRELARSAYFQFIMEYPQGKERLAKQMGFLVKNLEYQYVEGRESVMDTIHLLLSKVADDLAQELVGTFFVPLMMVLINDESESSRSMAGALLKKVFERADNGRTDEFLGLLQTWLGQDEKPLLERAALQVYCIFLDVNGNLPTRDVLKLQQRLTLLIKNNLVDRNPAEWELLYVTLQSTTKLCQIHTSTLFEPTSEPLWTEIRQCLHFPHAWVKLETAKLLGLYFASFARANTNVARLEQPLIGSHGLHLGSEDMIQLIRSSLRLLQVPGVSEGLATQSVRNLIFLGRFIGNITITSKGQAVPAEDKEPSHDDSEGENGYLSDHSDGSSQQEEKLVLQYIFERISVIIRREPINTRGPALIPKTASLQLLGALVKHLSTTQLEPRLPTILVPLHHLVDPTVPTPYSSDETFRESYKSLISTAQEVMAFMQDKFGTEEYIAQLSRVREEVKRRREGRRIKRRIEAVKDPEKLGREKRRKGERKHQRRKEKSSEERGKRRGW